MNPNTSDPVISMMEDQKQIVNMGGTMRLGSYECTLSEGSLAAQSYAKTHITERHRHRYEFNNAYLAQFEENGMMPVGKNPETGLVEVMEVSNHPFYVATQFHPEYKSTVENPHPLFVSFVKAAKEAQELKRKGALSAE